MSLELFSAVQPERVLIVDCSCHAAVWRYARLQRDESADIAPDRGQRVQGKSRNGIANRGVHGLQFGISRLYLHDFRRCSDFQLDVEIFRTSDVYFLVAELGRAESCFAYRQ